MKKIIKCIGISLLWCFYVTSVSYAQNHEIEEDKWNNTILSYIWAVGIKGDA
jgi:hypothetical protein